MQALETHVNCPLFAIREAFEPILMKTGAAKAIVFGSYALGQADEYSDLDLIIGDNNQRKRVYLSNGNGTFATGSDAAA